MHPSIKMTCTSPSHKAALLCRQHSLWHASIHEKCTSPSHEAALLYRQPSLWHASIHEKCTSPFHKAALFCRQPSLWPAFDGTFSSPKAFADSRQSPVSLRKWCTANGMRSQAICKACTCTGPGFVSVDMLTAAVCVRGGGFLGQAVLGLVMGPLRPLAHGTA